MEIQRDSKTWHFYVVGWNISFGCCSLLFEKNEHTPKDFKNNIEDLTSSFSIVFIFGWISLLHLMDNLWRKCKCKVFLPRVIPLGHWMSDATKTCLSTPFIPDFSILAGSPQSDQYRNLRTHTHVSMKQTLQCTFQLGIKCLHLA